MSRTYRRARTRYEYGWLLRTYVRQPFWRYQPIDPQSIEGRRILRRWHSDGQDTMQMVPAGYRRAEERRRRHRDEQVCRVIPQHGGGEELHFRRYRTVRYTYW
ncbi:MAG: hypothetical protein M0Z68_03165 [Gammaproteobacteria bacterium]|nr:hypothetical protein [Gammaproteobacteria bacterium]